MARYEQVTCDACGTQKQTANHWFVIWISESGLSIMTENQFRMMLREAAGSILVEQSRIDLCGEACVLKKVSELISK